MTDEIIWSDWLDFNAEQASKVPETSGVYMMHAAMKILYIGDSKNLRQSISESLNLACINTAKRFRYSITSTHYELKEMILKEYQEKHNGSRPKCME
jgi:excinuclease UvrABC nuclease subunit